MIRLIFFLIGFLCLVFGITDFILYLNLFTMGYTLLDFIHFVVLGLPGGFILLGFILIVRTIFKGKRKKNEYSL